MNMPNPTKNNRNSAIIVEKNRRQVLWVFVSAFIGWHVGYDFLAPDTLHLVYGFFGLLVGTVSSMALSGFLLMKTDHRSLSESEKTIRPESQGIRPWLNPKDNIYQGIFVFGVTSLSALSSWYFSHKPEMRLLATLLGCIGSLILSGFILMILGFARDARSREPM